jgi:hypothetical protein
MRNFVKHFLRSGGLSEHAWRAFHVSLKYGYWLYQDRVLCATKNASVEFLFDAVFRIRKFSGL